ncbi:TDT family transporter [Nakamurella sp.]|uniref:TDT family transporter n=1 Tax=Nakamurella sp. TaxID=1869182 RepID=UPI003B3B58E1
MTATLRSAATLTAVRAADRAADRTADRAGAPAVGPAARGVLPPAGPAWYGAVMGTGILATLTQTLAPGAWTARLWLVLGWALLVGLTAAFARRCGRRPGTLAGSLRPDQLPLWGMVAMGLLSVGAATATVLPPWWPAATGAAVLADGLLWVAGTALGLGTAIGFAAVLVRSTPGPPSTVWGLAVVPPMVSATVGAGLVRHLPPALQFPLLLVLAACFVLSLTLGAVIFALAYHHHWRVARLPIPASTTAWIPLGVVGQSTAAAQAMAVAAAPLVPAPVAGILQTVANDYGLLMLAGGVPLAGWAVAMTIRGFRARMPFVPGWWSLTFPIGTLALGSHLLGVGTGITAYLVAGLACWVTLCGTWLLCAVASIRALLGTRTMTRSTS